MFGSVASAMAHYAPCSVLVARESTAVTVHVGEPLAAWLRRLWR